MMAEAEPEAEPEIVNVVPIDDMDKVSFTRHMTNRHQDSLGGVRYMPEDIYDDIEHMYRIFHERLHRIYTIKQIGHTHESA